MNIHLANAIDLYESNDIDIQRLIQWHLCYGIVASTPKVFALCFHSNSDDPEKAVSFEESDTLYVTICCGDMENGLGLVKDNYDYISFRRDFKGSIRTRLLNMKKFYSKLQ
jgi:hypothetical protein